MFGSRYAAHAPELAALERPSARTAVPARLEWPRGLKPKQICTVDDRSRDLP